MGKTDTKVIIKTLRNLTLRNFRILPRPISKYSTLNDQRHGRANSPLHSIEVPSHIDAKAVKIVQGNNYALYSNPPLFLVKSFYVTIPVEFL